MKQLLLLLLFALIATAAISQDSTVALSRFEEFTSRPGKMLKTEAKELGQAGGWHVYWLRTTDVQTGLAAAAVLIDGTMNAVPFLADPRTLYIDSADVDSVANALAYFLSESERLKPLDDLQFSYHTPRDIAVSCYYSAFSDLWRFRIGKVYQKLRSPVAGSVILLNRKRLTELVALLKKTPAAGR